MGMLSWWYGRGWVSQWRRMGGRFVSTLEFFSVGSLLKTLFAPFRQISAVSGPGNSLGDSFRGGVDRLISRIIGSMVRSATILFGVIAIALQAAYTAVIMIMWWLVPLAPIVGAILYATEWVPKWM